MQKMSHRHIGADTLSKPGWGYKWDMFFTGVNISSMPLMIASVIGEVLFIDLPIPTAPLPHLIYNSITISPSPSARPNKLCQWSVCCSLRQKTFLNNSAHVSPKLFLILPFFMPLYEKCFVFLLPNCVNVQRNECIRTKWTGNHST